MNDDEPTDAPELIRRGVGEELTVAATGEEDERGDRFEELLDEREHRLEPE